jgi:hypothetical protein
LAAALVAVACVGSGGDGPPRPGGPGSGGSSNGGGTGGGAASGSGGSANGSGFGGAAGFGANAGSGNGSGSGGSGNGSGSGGIGGSGNGSGSGGTGGSGNGSGSGGTGGSGNGGGVAGNGTGGFGANGSTSCGAFGTVSSDKACTDYSTSYCATLALCAPAELSQAGYDSEATCRDRVHLSCLQHIIAPGSFVEPRLYAAAANIYAKSSCALFYSREATALLTIDPLCGVAGTKSGGSGCYVDDQCDSLVCKTSGGLCGKCTTVGQIGDPCSSTAGCAPGSYCDTQVNQECVKQGGLGQSCTSHQDCTPDLRCAFSTCQLRQGSGANCSSERDCQAELICGGSKCKAPALGEAGASCNSEPLSCNSFKNFYCTGGKCVAGTTGLPGQSCTATSVCKGGAKCVIPSGQSQGVCMTVAVDGQSCNASTGPYCQDPAECVNGKCEPLDGTICP